MIDELPDLLTRYRKEIYLLVHAEDLRSREISVSELPGLQGASGGGPSESYQSFTMPGLYRVLSGIDAFDPKFNVVAPGADPEIFFPFTEEDRRMEDVKREIKELVYGSDGPDPHRGGGHELRPPRVCHAVRRAREVVEDGRSGFHIDPYLGDEAARRMKGFFRRCGEEPGYWEEISAAAIARVKEKYDWDSYARRLLSLSRIYGFWKYITNIEREETRRYPAPGKGRDGPGTPPGQSPPRPDSEAAADCKVGLTPPEGHRMYHAAKCRGSRFPATAPPDALSCSAQPRI